MPKKVKTTAKKTVKKPKKEEKKEELIGAVTHYYDKIEVGIIKMKGGLAVGEEIHFKGITTDFEQKVQSIQIEHEQVDKVKKGDMIGMKVKDRVREGDLVYKAK